MRRASTDEVASDAVTKAIRLANVEDGPGTVAEQVDAW